MQNGITLNDNCGKLLSAECKWRVSDRRSPVRIADAGFGGGIGGGIGSASSGDDGNGDGEYNYLTMDSPLCADPNKCAIIVGSLPYNTSLRTIAECKFDARNTVQSHSFLSLNYNLYLSHFTRPYLFNRLRRSLSSVAFACFGSLVEFGFVWLALCWCVKCKENSISPIASAVR